MNLLDTPFSESEAPADSNAATAAIIAPEKPASEAIEPESRSVERFHKRLPANIPFPKNFIGRDDELAILAKRHAIGQRVFVLHGPDGIGKTALGRRFAETLAGEYDAFVELAVNGSEAFDIIRAVLSTFDPDESPELTADDLNGRVSALGEKHRTIVVADDAPASDDQFKQLADAGCCVIVTRRHPNADRDETFEVGKLSDDDAVLLLCSNGGEARIADNAWHIARRSGNLPLAILLARCLLLNQPAIDVDTFSERLRLQRLQYIDELHGAIRLTYDVLGEELQIRLRLLAIFPETFEMKAAAAVWRVEAETARTSLLALAAYRMIEAYPARSIGGADRSGSIRFRLHAVIREFAKSTIARDESSAAGYDHSRFYAEQLEATAGEDQPSEYFDLERHNIIAGFNRAKSVVMQEPAYAEVCLFYTAAADVLAQRLRSDEWFEWIDAGIAAAENVGDNRAGVALLKAKGSALRSSGKFDEAMECLEPAVDLAFESGDELSACQMLSLIGMCCNSAGEDRKAVEAYERAMPVLEGLGESELLASVLSNLGVSLNKIRRFRDGIEALRNSLAMARRLGNRSKESQILSNLGSAYSNLDDPKHAFDLYRASMLIARDIGNRASESWQLANIGNCYFKMGKRGPAFELWQRSLKTLAETDPAAAETIRRRIKFASGR